MEDAANGSVIQNIKSVISCDRKRYLEAQGQQNTASQIKRKEIQNTQIAMGVAKGLLTFLHGPCQSCVSWPAFTEAVHLPPSSSM